MSKYALGKDPSSHSEPLLNRVVKDITAAQIPTLNSVPIELVAAPGVGKVVWPKSVVLDFKGSEAGAFAGHSADVGMPGFGSVLNNGACSITAASVVNYDTANLQ